MADGSGAYALGGAVIGGCISLIGTLLVVREQSRQKREEIRRKAAENRIDYLYEPLANILRPTAPYEDNELSEEAMDEVLKLIDKHQRYASSDLLNVYWELCYARCHHLVDTTEPLDEKLMRIVDEEYAELKELLGYGVLLKKERPIGIFTNRIKDLFAPVYKKIERKWFLHKLTSRKRSSDE
jgi:hypothetical protein